MSGQYCSRVQADPHRRLRPGPPGSIDLTIDDVHYRRELSSITCALVIYEAAGNPRRSASQREAVKCGANDEHGHRLGMAESCLAAARCNQCLIHGVKQGLRPGWSSTAECIRLCDKRLRRVVWFREQSAWPRGMGCEMRSR